MYLTSVHALANKDSRQVELCEIISYLLSALNFQTNAVKSYLLKSHFIHPVIVCCNIL